MSEPAMPRALAQCAGCFAIRIPADFEWLSVQDTLNLFDSAKARIAGAAGYHSASALVPHQHELWVRIGVGLLPGSHGLCPSCYDTEMTRHEKTKEA